VGPVRRTWTILVAALAVLLGGACGAAPAPEPERATRPVVHARGTTEVPVAPQRVVVLDTGELDVVLALGVTPVGAVTAQEGAPLQTYLGDRVRDVGVVGTIAEPDLEAIAALAPDLILSNEVRHADLYDALSGIAPTVFAADVGDTWKDTVRLAGEALGRTAEAERVLAEHAERARAVGARFGDPAAVEVSTVRFLPDAIRLYGEASFIGTVLADAGFSRPAVQRVPETFVEVSAEQIGQADGDLLLHAAYLDGADLQAEVLAGPLWPGVPAVAGGRAFPVSDDLWYLGIGPIAAGQVLDELARLAPA
jgi:iron complex transport system substrate-binding protein